MSQSTALASLTATYTDSEGEEETQDLENSKTTMENLQIGNSELVASTTTPLSASSEAKSNSSSRPSSPATSVRVTTKVAKLVSYHDDTIASDNEDGGNEEVQNQVIMMISEEKNSDANEIKKEEEILETDGVQIPPEPLTQCSAELHDKFSKYHEKMLTHQLDMNALIQKRKDFRNPSIYEKLIQHCGINELGTNYPPTIYDPLKWSKESFYKELAKVQKVEMDKREKETKSKVQFVSGTKKIDDDNKKRKSKWDQPGGNSLGSQSIKPAGLVQPSLTSSATGTKGTVISAFGSLPLPKKARL